MLEMEEEYEGNVEVYINLCVFFPSLSLIFMLTRIVTFVFYRLQERTFLLNLLILGGLSVLYLMLVLSELQLEIVCLVP